MPPLLSLPFVVRLRAMKTVQAISITCPIICC